MALIHGRVPVDERMEIAAWFDPSQDSAVQQPIVGEAMPQLGLKRSKDLSHRRFAPELNQCLQERDLVLLLGQEKPPLDAPTTCLDVLVLGRCS